MIRINLLPVREINAESERRRDLVIAAVSLTAAAMILVSVYLYQMSQLSRLARELPAVQKEVEILNGKLKEMGDLGSKIKELKSKHKVIQELSDRKIGPLRIMDGIAAAIPATLWLLEIKQNGGNLVINGLATDNHSVADFMNSLSRSSHFKDVELIESTQADEKVGPFKKFALQSAISYRSSGGTGAESSGQAPSKKAEN